jgi:hypothetical protein
MTRFAILEWPSENDNKSSIYRGLERNGPPPPPDTPPIPELWTWYASNGDDYIYDEKKATDFIRRYKYLDKPYDLIRIESKFEPRNNDKFLGIDVTSFGGYLSAIKSGILYWKPERRRPLIELIWRYFKPRLNANMLFQNKEDADLFTHVVKDIQSIGIGYFEPNFDYSPHFLYLVDLTV